MLALFTLSMAIMSKSNVFVRTEKHSIAIPPEKERDTATGIVYGKFGKVQPYDF